MPNERGGYFLIEARWEKSHNAPGEDTFFMIEELGGSLDDAKRTAQAYHDRHVAGSPDRLEWIAGINRKKRCYYAYAEFVTLRITD